MKEFKQYKIKAKNSKEKAEIIELFIGIGYKDCYTDNKHNMVITYHNGDIQSVGDNFFMCTPREQITIEQLREMSMKEYLVRVDGEYVLHVGGVKPSGAVEVPSGMDVAYCDDSGFISFTKLEMGYRNAHIIWQRNEPQKKKEYIAEVDGVYRLVDDSEVVGGRIEVPEGAECLIRSGRFLSFWKEGAAFFVGTDKAWDSKYMSKSKYEDICPQKPKALWQRDKTESVLSVDVEKHSHYFINVSDVDEVDFYEIAGRFGVTDPCVQHILKKCLAIGKRGHKDTQEDMLDIHKTAKRMIEINGIDQQNK